MKSTRQHWLWSDWACVIDLWCCCLPTSHNLCLPLALSGKISLAQTGSFYSHESINFSVSKWLEQKVKPTVDWLVASWRDWHCFAPGVWVSHTVQKLHFSCHEKCTVIEFTGLKGTQTLNASIWQRRRCEIMHTDLYLTDGATGGAGLCVAAAICWL